MPDARARLSRPDLPERLTRLGFRPDDAEATLAVAATVLGDDARLRAVDQMADVLGTGIGQFEGETEAPFPAEDDDELGAGVLPMLALLVAADDVQDFHRSRGVTDEISWRSLSDLGQQVWVHRLTHETFGLHTQGWLRTAWSGALYWLGRLQFNLQKTDGAWVISTHIPRTGPLTPESVDASFAEATAFFADRFPDLAASTFWCSSWLLDPQLTEVLQEESNMARFQRRWQLQGEPVESDKDALFFTFARRGDVDLAALPRETTLQRAIIDRLQSGGHWYSCAGTHPLTETALTEEAR